MQEQRFASIRERMVGETGVMMLIGPRDTGKTTLGRLLIADALDAGLRCALVDADTARSSVGPPACVGLKFIKTGDDLEDLGDADALRFVGSTHPRGVVLPHVVAVAALVAEARERAEFIVVDTTSAVAGVVGQTLKYHLAELAKPSVIIALQRGSEMEPIVGMLRRFLSARVAVLVPEAQVVPAGPVQAAEELAAAFREELAAPLPRWRVQSTVFAPTLPDGFELEPLDGTIVGIQDSTGECLGLGVLDHDGDTLRVATHHGELMSGLRIGSLKVDLDTFATTRIRLRELFFGLSAS
jgi:polynucleotide 5'-kinase involved in rRNA processing